ncbi:sugar transferase [Fictibacillus sp. b24]|uniref:sugar transferase n=1 Tax=unclassified Fictibacillus TaxID=2644029 RepID=UPI0025A05733|nr:sugar transferase [Fictibacillus sp. b24]MDM5316419.1 sugar transferase [Fictibacillus sp. b24]
MKRLMDVIGSFILLVILGPLLLLASIGVRLKLGPPVLYTQWRPGLYEKPFLLYKLRTMKSITGVDGELLPDKERLTPYGKWLRKFSIDEIPQLYNVLKGDMSLVGPRPLLLEYLPLYTTNQRKRHNVKPGLTGWAQVNGRNQNSWDQTFALDLWYVHNQSLWLDIKILIKTIPIALKSKGINHPGHVTRDQFKGHKKCKDPKKHPFE